MDEFLVSDDFVKSTMARRFGLSPKRTGREWHSPCPKCGGRDRFVIFSNGGMWCRNGQCDFKGWLDDDQKQFKPDPLLLQASAERIALERAERQRRDEEWQKGYRAGYWQGWHDAMTQVNRAWWNDNGISNHQIEFYGLGYTPNKRIETDSGEMTVAAYTIPIRDPETWDVVNVQYRIAEPPDGVGKYRQEGGITAAAFYAAPDMMHDPDRVIVCEGAKKAMVIYDHIDAAIQVIGLPGKAPGEIVLEKLKRYGRIYLMLDPGCILDAERIRRLLPQIRRVDLPDKPDDLFLAGMRKAQLADYMRLAR